MKHALTLSPRATPILDLIQGGLDKGYRQALRGFMEADGTHYSMTVIPVVEDYEDRFLGCIEGDGYIVINGINRQAYLFRKTGYLDFDYVSEKLGRGLTACDMENVIHLLHTMISTRTAPPYETE
ncbi:unnamed protein product [marine sediment metagenome]|uniref:Uncharacterized protein n=1 Tax=marine sediment metagenome TaxID=412755 RepID=X1P8J9_9ZZZZ